jgi:SAM-dependent methyltransferase
MLGVLRRPAYHIVERAEALLTGRAAAPSTDSPDADTGSVVVRVREPDDGPTEPIRLNKLCELEDWRDPRRIEAMRRVLPYFLDISDTYPAGMEHRKHWEYAQLLCGLESLGALRDEGLVISVGPSNEEPVYYLTQHVRWVFVSDIRWRGTPPMLEADARKLVDPDRFARFPYRRNRLVLQWMDGLELRHEDETFDAAFSLSSLQHFGGFEAARRALAEMARVTRRGGVVAVATECIVNGVREHQEREFTLFTPTQVDQLARSVTELELVEPIDFGISPATLRKVKPLGVAVEEARRGYTDYPAVLMGHRGRHYTSMMLFLRRR